MTTVHVISQVVTIVSALVALGAAIAAFMGLNTWRRELKGREEFQLARRVLLFSCKLREAFRQIRSAISLADETKGKPQGMDDSVYVFASRFNSRNDLWSELEAVQLEVEVLFGKEAAAKLQPLREHVSEYWSTLMTASNATSGGRSLWDDEEVPYLKEAREILIARKGDDFQAAVETGIAQLQDEMRKHLR